MECWQWCLLVSFVLGLISITEALLVTSSEDKIGTIIFTVIMLGFLSFFLMLSFTRYKNLRSLKWNKFFKYIILFSPILALMLLWFI